MPTRATYNVTVRWTRNKIKDMTAFDSSGGANDDISADVEQISIRRGRSDPYSAISAGTCTIRLRDPDGKYVAGYGTSALVASASDGLGTLLPYRTVRVRATLSGTDYDRFYGFITRIVANPNDRTATIEASDGLFLLSQPFGSALSETGSVRAVIEGALTGDSFAVNSVAGNGNATPTAVSFPIYTDRLSIINGLLDSDLGLLYFQADGKAIYRDRHWRNRSPQNAAQSTLTDVVLRLTSGVDGRGIVNMATVTGTTGGAQTASDITSQVAYGGGNVSLSTSYLTTATDALNTATWIVATRKDPAPSAYAADLNGDLSSATLTAILARDLCDRVNITATRQDASDYFILGISETIDASRRHTAQWTLERYRAANCGFVIGYSTFGGAALGYAV